VLPIPACFNTQILQIRKFLAIPIPYPGRAGWIPAKIFLLSLGMALAIAQCSASIVIVNLTADAIYIGADGRITETDNVGKETPKDGCKVRSFGPLVVADTGTVGGPTGASDAFDIWVELKSIKASTVAEFADQVAKTLPAKFQGVFTERSRRTGRPFQEFIPGDIAIAGFENGRPAFVRIIFVTVDGAIEANPKNYGAQFMRDAQRMLETHTKLPRLDLSRFSAQRMPGTRMTLLFGEFDLFPIGQEPECPTDSDIVEEMRCQLAAYIKADPLHINKPIVIRKVTATGSEWIQRSKPCDDQGK
jgi:hypothetical protein